VKPRHTSRALYFRLPSAFVLILKTHLNEIDAGKGVEGGNEVVKEEKWLKGPSKL
jgi:hypothetical protein